MLDYTMLVPENEAVFRPFIPVELAGALFAEGSPLLGLGALDGGEAAGALVARVRGEMLSIESLYVPEGKRGRGLGGELLRGLLALARAAGNLLAVEAALLPAGAPEEDAAVRLFAGLDFALKAGEDMEFTGSLGQFLAAAPALKPAAGCLPFGEVPAISFKLLAGGLEGTLCPIALPPNPGEVDMALSFAATDKAAITALVAVGREGKGLRVLWAHSTPEAGAAGGRAILGLLCRAAQAAAAAGMPPETPLYISAVTPFSRALAQRFLPGGGRALLHAVYPLDGAEPEPVWFDARDYRREIYGAELPKEVQQDARTR